MLSPDIKLSLAHTYGIFFNKGIMNASVSPISLVPSPATVLLKAQGSLVDSNNKSNIGLFVSDSDAQEAEANRLLLEPVLDMLSLKFGITRDSLVFIYAFQR